MQAVTWIGAITAVFAASIAVAQNDIKRILAYSTVSQLGYMMMGLGVGGVAVGMFHLITHAFFKALLFMGAGSVIHGCHDEQDIRRMGGLRKWMPITFATYAIGMLALAGFPLFFSGFWSKDEILHAAEKWPVSHIPFYLGIIGAFLTAFYMTRQVAAVFFGPYRGGSTHPEGAVAREIHREHEPHESPPVMTLPLMALAFCAIALSAIGTPWWPWFQEFLGKRHEAGEGGVFGLMVLSSIIVFLGLGAGWWLYGRRPWRRADEPDALEVARADIFSLLRNKYYIDEIYEMTVIRFNAWWAWVCDRMDAWLWGGAVQLVSYVVVGLSWVNRMLDEYVVNLGFDQGCKRLTLGGKMLSRLQNGQAHSYLRVIGVGLVVLVILLIRGSKGG
jgi:NADH-quinone oxidoreductase subunit L